MRLSIQDLLPVGLRRLMSKSGSPPAREWRRNVVSRWRQLGYAVILCGSSGDARTEIVEPKLPSVSPNGRFEVRLHKSTHDKEDASDTLVIHDKLKSQDHDVTELACAAPSLAFRAEWSPDGLMVFINSWFPNHEERVASGVLRWHKGKFRRQALPAGAWPHAWRGDEKLECNVPLNHVYDMSKQPTKPALNVTKQNSEIRAIPEPTEDIETTSPDGKFEIVRLTKTAPSAHACVLRGAKSHELIQVCFSDLRGGDFQWSPDSKCVLFHHEMEGSGVHEPSGYFVLKWNGKLFDEVPIGGHSVYGPPKWNGSGKLVCKVRAQKVLTWNPQRKAFEP
jgi:hypothetical protein